MIKTARLDISAATKEDIPFIIDLESHEENRDFLWIGTFEEHLSEIEDPNHLLLVFRTKEEENPIGYALIRIDTHSHWFELRRIAISAKGQGYGKEAMQALLQYAFETLHMNKVWLDVYPHNTIGIHLYESLGMHRDGVLRQNYWSESHGFLDQMIYSMLQVEYQKIRHTLF